jgi:hypothetical protein
MYLKGVWVHFYGYISLFPEHFFSYIKIVCVP